ncbi:MAG: glycosyltransferase [Leptospirales bacterium]|nr:glycosyltransferase [Leptospirales bacterium]
MTATNETRRAAILAPAWERDDAVGNDVQGMADALRRQGWETCVFAPNGERGLTFRHPRRLPGFLRNRRDLLIYHYCIGWPEALQRLRDTPAQVVIKYHSITPPQFYEPYNPAIAAICEQGVAMLAEFAQLDGVRWLADSAYNAAELAAHGLEAGRAAIVPPFHRIEQMLAEPTDLRRFAAWRASSVEQPRFVMVGRIAPNKGYVRLLQSFAELIAQTGRAAQLILPGRRSAQIPDFNQQLDLLIAKLGISENVCWAGRLNSAALKAAYLAATAFVSLSEHEGFCVPLVEAMALGTPVIAAAAGAMAETLGDAGLAVTRSEPLEIAALLWETAQDTELCLAMAQRGRARYLECFHPQRIEELFLAAVDAERAQPTVRELRN